MSDQFIVVSPLVQIPRDELEFTFARSSGPGGQNVNKVNSKAVLRWGVATSRIPDDVRARFLAKYASQITTEGDLLITSQRTRDQAVNIEDCLEKLRALVSAVLVRPKPRRRTRPTLASKRRRLEGKKDQSQKKQHRRPPDME